MIGASLRRKEDPRLLTGRGKYAGDVRLPGMLHAVVLRSTHAHARLRGIDATAALSDVTVLAPIPRPAKLICVGLNYRDHAIESKMEIPKVPTIFSKFSSAVIGPGENIVVSTPEGRTCTRDSGTPKD